ncbi:MULTISPECIES: ABC transporter ATP-binding protein [Lactobacillus]|uniref:ABC transporter ATP-binding protein n=1 Tax=Lactobacillus xujianguonis TaxID=2495899 RepID=A0A437SXD8_9LACO|nr:MULTISPECIES: ABC transporter ATP-binding protein [Lactobacillus]RVU71588.1 ABC transporter ATP-binding protein [Lactobacillus xujianguonis]RVU77760.1 ABC transporter ATP-binding protein [Lactobacillus xujianguonis]
MNLKELFKLNPFRFIVSLSFQVLGALAGVSASLFLTWQFNAVRQKQLTWFFIWTGGQLACWVVSYLVLTWSNILWQRHTQDYLHLIRQELTDHYFETQQELKIAKVQSRMTNDLNLLAQDYLLSIRKIAGMLASILVVAVSLFTFQWSLLVACLIFAAVQILLPKVMSKALQKATQRVSAANENYLKTLGDWLIGFSEVRRYLAFNHLFAVVTASSNRVEQANVQKQKVDQELDYLNQLAYSIGDALIFLLTAFLVVNNLASFGLVASIGNFSSDLFGSLQGIADNLGRINSSQSLRQTIMAEKSKIIPKKNAAGQAPWGIATDKLAINFANGEKLTFPDLKINPGEKILLTGDSGAGKSTLFKLLLGELTPSSGKIHYFDQENEEITPKLNEITYLPQEPVLFPASISENVTMFDQSLTGQVDQALAKVELKKDLNSFDKGKETVINLDQLNVSGGQRQKIVLARGQIHRSKMLLIDEETSAIDRQATMKILQKLVQTDATIVFIAHNFSERMRDLFDREIFLEK